MIEQVEKEKKLYRSWIAEDPTASYRWVASNPFYINCY